MIVLRMNAGLRARLIPALAAVALLAGCARDDEAAMRARLGQWFALGETLAFGAGPDCAAGAFRLVDMQVKAAMPVSDSVADLSRSLPRRGIAALNDPDVAPDAAMIGLANSDRALGMGMRRVALEARACMGGMTESAFRYALANPAAVLAWEAETGTLMLADPRTRVLVVAMGAG